MSDNSHLTSQNLIATDELNRLKLTLYKSFAAKMLLLLIVFLAIGFIAQTYFYQQKQKSLSNSAATQLTTIEALIDNNLNFLENQAHQLAANPELHRYLITRNEISRDFVLNNWQSISERLQWFSRITFYSFAGVGDIGIDYDPMIQQAQIIEVTSEQRQEFDEKNILLNVENKTHVSAIDLKKQFNEPVYPLTPIVDIFTQLNITENRTEGYIELSILADKLLAPIKQMKQSAIGDIVLIDRRGSYIKGHTDGEEWGHYLQSRQAFNFATQFPDIWPALQRQTNGTITTNDNLFIFQTIQLQGTSDESYYLINQISRDLVQESIAVQSMRVNTLLIFLFIMSGVALWYRSNQKRDSIIKQHSLELVSALFNSNDAILITNTEGKITTTNQIFLNLLGISGQETLGNSIKSVLYKKKKSKLLSQIEQDVKELGFWRGELSLKTHVGEKLPCLVSVAPVRTGSGQYSHYVIHVIDISKQKEVENELKLAAVALETKAGIIITDANGLIQRVNSSFMQITGYSAEEVIGKNPNVLSSGKHDSEFYQAMWSEIKELGYWQGELWNKRKNGEVFPEWITITTIKDETGQIQNFVATFHDITVTKQLEQRLESLASTDPMTGCLNRRAFESRFKEQLSTAKRYHQNFGLILFDIDHFKHVNDNYGHDKGDEILIKTVGRVKNSLREADIIARWGGEEFIVLLPMNTIDETILAAERLRESIKTMATDPRITCSFGVTSLQVGDDFDKMLKRADVALYQAKESGRDRVILAKSTI